MTVPVMVICDQRIVAERTTLKNGESVNYNTQMLVGGSKVSVTLTLMLAHEGTLVAALDTEMPDGDRIRNIVEGLWG